MLTESELASMRSDLEASLPATAIIQTQQWLSDGGGGGTTTWVAAGTVACRVAPVASSGEGERVQGGRLHPDSELVFTLPAGTEIVTDAQIVYGGGTFTVASLRAPRSFEVSRRVEVKEVK